MDEQAIPPLEQQRPVALITGATRGIGRAIADELSSTHHVVVGGTNPDAVAEVIAALESAEPFVADLTDASAVTALVERLTRLDVLVHSAGVALGSTIADTDRATWQRGFELNVVAVADLTRLSLPLLRAVSGMVITLNSGSGYRSGAGGGPYAATKFALRALTDALREEERGRVRVTSIHPGRTDSDMQRQLQAGMGRAYDASEFLTPQAVAQTVRWALSTPESGVVEELSIRPVFVPGMAH